jgi:hypothetical protein
MMLLNAIPRVILAPLVIWLGIEISSKIALAVVLVAVLISFAVYNGIKDVNQLGRSGGHPRRRTFGFIARSLYSFGHGLGARQPQSHRRVCFYQRLRWRIRRGHPRLRVFAAIRPEHL